MEQPKDTRAKVHSPCPKCGNQMPEDDLIWVFQARFYCSEQCCREAASNR